MAVTNKKKEKVSTMPAKTHTDEQISMKLKLLVNKETEKVLFAEADKGFVDVLFSFLTLPLGNIARLLEEESNMGAVTVGCLNSLYRSVRHLDEDCLKTVTCKAMLLQPRNSAEDYCSSLKLNIDDTEPTKYFLCSDFDDCYDHCLSTTTNNTCECESPLTQPIPLKRFEKGFVKNGATFVITDDLTVLPNSMQFTSFGLLQKSGIKSTSSVKETTVNVTRKEVLDLLKHALISKSPLTDLFLGKKSSLKRSRVFTCDVENSSDIKISLKLVIRKSDGKILFAQGEQDFADFLLSFLAFPLGGVARILGGSSTLGSIDSLYKSISDLNVNKYFVSKKAKSMLANPHLAPQFKLSNPILPIQRYVQYYCYFLCETWKDSVIHNEFFVSDEYRVDVENKKRVTLVDDRSCRETSVEGFVKELRTYVVTDDLVFSPSSPFSTLYLIKEMETPLDDLMEKVVTIGIKECLSILKASLTSSSALTDGLGHLLAEVKEEK